MSSKDFENLKKFVIQRRDQKPALINAETNMTKKSSGLSSTWEQQEFSTGSPDVHQLLLQGKIHFFHWIKYISHIFNVFHIFEINVCLIYISLQYFTCVLFSVPAFVGALHHYDSVWEAGDSDDTRRRVCYWNRFSVCHRSLTDCACQWPMADRHILRLHVCYPWLWFLKGAEWDQVISNHRKRWCYQAFNERNWS